MSEQDFNYILSSLVDEAHDWNVDSDVKV